MVADLFINVCIVIALIFIYMKLRWSRFSDTVYTLTDLIVDGTAGGFMGYILMIFSIQVTEETIMDLRFIPILLLVIFVRKRSAFLASVLIVSGRFFIGINRSAVYSIYMVGILLIGFILLEKLVKKRLNLFMKTLVLSLYANMVVSYFLVIMVGETDLLAPLFLVYWLFSLLGSMSAVFMVNYIRKSEYLFAKYENESSKDFLTDLYNVRRFDEDWNSLAKKAFNSHSSLTLILLDIDHFKAINDTYGHSVGDYVLKELAQVIVTFVGSRGSVYRKGGEEFAVILPYSSKAETELLAEELRHKVETHQFIPSEEAVVEVTVSLGAAVYPETTDALKTMIEAADNALYHSKNSGRNQLSFNG